MRGHATMWRSCSLTDWRMHDKLALLQADEQRCNNAEALQRLRAERDKLLAEIEEDQSERKLVLMSECTLTHAEMEKIGRPMTSSCPFSESLVRQQRQVAMRCPAPIADPVPKSKHDEYRWSTRKVEMPTWTFPIIDRRDYYQNIAIAVARPNQLVEYWKVLYAVKSPRYFGDPAARA